MKYILLIIVVCVYSIHIYSQEKYVLTLSDAIAYATKNSLSSKSYDMQYLASYWNYRSYKASRLPSLKLNTTPVSYYRYLAKRYDSQNNMDVFREQRSWQSSGGLTLTQAFTPLGGNFYVESDLDFLRNFGASTYNQFSTVPIRIGYTHNILGYNEYKWEKLIEPKRFEKAMKEYVYNREQMSITVSSLFFQLAQSKMAYELAEKQLVSADTLYSIGQKRFDLALLTKQSLLSLKLDVVNAKNALSSAKSQLSRSMFQLASFLSLPTDSEIEVSLSDEAYLPDVAISKALELMHANSYIMAEQENAVLEAKQNADRVKKQSRFNASLTASVGFNQQSDELSKAWKEPLRQDIVSLSVSIPLLDWGQSRGQRQMAKTNLALAELKVQQSKQSQDQELMLLVDDLKLNYDYIASSREALKIAEESYDESVRLFISGASDIATLSIAESRRSNAVNAYVGTLANFWGNFYKLRSMTMYDWVLGIPLIDVVNFDELVNR